MVRKTVSRLSPTSCDDVVTTKLGLASRTTTPLCVMQKAEFPIQVRLCGSATVSLETSQPRAPKRFVRLQSPGVAYGVSFQKPAHRAVNRQG